MSSVGSQTRSVAQELGTRESGRSHVRIGLLANEWAAAALIFAVTRVIALLGAYSGVRQIIAAEPSRNKGWVSELFLMWDSSWYVTTGINGYYWHANAEGGTNVAFPPLLPAVLNVLSHVLKFVTFGWDWGEPRYGSYVAAGIIISNLSFFAALIFLIKWLMPRLGRRGAYMVALGVASLPLSFFFSAIYTEGLFLMLVLASLLVARSGLRYRWAAAGSIAMLSTLLKFGGLLLLPVLLVQYLSQVGWRPRKLRADILWLGLIPTALLLYMSFLWLRFGNPTAFLDSEYKGWGHQASFFWGTYWDDAVVKLINHFNGTLPHDKDWVWLHGNGNPLYAILDVAMPPVLLVGAWFARKKIVAAEWAWLIVGILYPLSSGTSNSLARYMLPLWPGLVWLGTLQGRWRWLAVVWVIVSLALLGWCAGIYGNAKWIG